MSVYSSLLWICILLSGSAGIAQQRPEFVMQRSHHKQISAAAFSPDGKMLLSGGVDGIAILWDVESGRVIRQFNVNGNIECLAFSTGTTALFGVQGGMRAGAPLKAIQVWDIALGKQLGELGPFSIGALRTALTADGRYAATATASGDTIWDTQSGQAVTSFHGSSRFDLEGLEVIDFSSSGDRILIGGADGEVKLWDTKSGQPVGHYGPVPNQFFALALSPDGHRGIIGWNTKKFGYTMSGSPAVISVWDAVTGKEGTRFEVGDTLVGSVALSSDGSRLLASLSDGTFRLWSLSSRTEIWNIGSFPTTLNKAIFSPDGTKVLTLALEKLTLRDASNGKPLRQFAGASSETTSIVFTSRGSLVTGSRDNTASVWDLKLGGVSRHLKGHTPTPYFTGVTGVAVSADARTLATAGEDGTAKLWNVDRGSTLHSFIGHSDSIFSIAMSADGTRVLTGSADKTAKLWESASGREICTCSGHTGTVNAVAFTPDDKKVVTGGSEGSIRIWGATDCSPISQIALPQVGAPVTYAVQLPESHHVREYLGGRTEIKALSVFDHGSLIIVGTSIGEANIWNLDTQSQLLQIPNLGATISAVATLDEGNTVATGGTDSLVRLWDRRNGSAIRSLAGHVEPVTDIATRREGNLLAATSSDGTTIIWSYATGERLATLTSEADGGWAVEGGEDGRFDADELENLPSSWVFPDDPLHALSPEIFMRDYYEPRLLPRLLACKELEAVSRDACEKEFKAVRPLASLNRVQPLVSVNAEWKDEAAGVAVVKVVVQSNSDPGMKNGKTKTKPYDVRLFRDGQLVGWAPKTSVEWQLQAPPSGSDAEKTEELDLQRWREKTEVKGLDARGAKEVSFPVQVPRRSELKQVVFTAYAFNEDRVKSATASATLMVDKPLQVRKGTAYLISIGVNRTESSPAWDLHYAVNDARQMSEVVGDKLQATRQFADVVRLRLVSDTDRPQAGETAATKAHLQAVLDVLAGRRRVDEQLKKEIPGIERAAKAQPEGVVLLSFSSHGYTDQRGVFHIVLEDIGRATPQDRITAELQRNSLSSDVLSGWLRDVDAGEITMIVDACHSEATVAAEGFKPGPMGSRGLGQLAYDKGMRILAASKSNEEAMELGGVIKQGLLSYALVEEGLVEGKAAKDGRILISSWLAYAEQEVPNLYKTGNAKGLDGGKAPALNGRDIIYLGPDQTPAAYQQPVLFDFNKNKTDTLLNAE